MKLKGAAMKCTTCGATKEDKVHKGVTVTGLNYEGKKVKETFLLHGDKPMVTKNIFK